jgi:hypothetical protein
MKTRHTTAALATILGLFIGAVGAFAEGPQDGLIGKWKGYRTARGRGKAEERRDHSFTVKAIREVEGGKWEADAVDGQDRPLPMTVTVIDGVVHVEYMTTSGSETIHLKLQEGTVLRGEARPRGSNVNLDVRLEKQ